MTTDVNPSAELSIYEQLVDESSSVMLRLDTAGNITFINRYGCAFFEYAEDELIGKPLIGTLTPPTESTGRDLAAMLRRFYEFPLDFVSNLNENIKKSGERVWIAWTNKAEYDSRGWISNILCVGIDITVAQRDLLKLQAENILLRSTLNAFDDALFITDASGALKAYNKPFRTMFPDAIGAFADKNTMQLLATIADHVVELDQEVFRQAAGTALAASSNMVEGDFVHGRMRLARGGQGANISWQARPRTIYSVYEGLLWIFRSH